MLNKRRHTGKSFILIIAFFLFNFEIVRSKLYASDTPVETSLENCQVTKPEEVDSYKFIDSQAYDGIQHLYGLICKAVENKSWDLNRGNEIVEWTVVRCGVCRENHIYKGFEEHLKKVDMPESLVLAFDQFCQSTYDPNGFAWIDFKLLEKIIEWLGKEIFCQLTHEIAYPSGFWEKVFEPDLPSTIKFKEKTNSLCQQLRIGHISYGEAVYRWEQAILEYRQQFAPDMTKKAGKALFTPIEKLLDMFK